MNKLREIFTAYYKKFNPSKDQELLAEARYEICKECPKLTAFLHIKQKKLVEKCGECGCVISAKIFSPKENACPLNKWEEVDKMHFKKTKTII
mgnify:CR=1 FL=1